MLPPLLTIFLFLALFAPRAIASVINEGNRVYLVDRIGGISPWPLRDGRTKGRLSCMIKRPERYGTRKRKAWSASRVIFYNRVLPRLEAKDIRWSAWEREYPSTRLMKYAWPAVNTNPHLVVEMAYGKMSHTACADRLPAGRAPRCRACAGCLPGPLRGLADQGEMGAGDPSRRRVCRCHDHCGGRLVDVYPFFGRQAVVRAGSAGGQVLWGPGPLGVQPAHPRIPLAPVSLGRPTWPPPSPGASALPMPPRCRPSNSKPTTAAAAG
jgi:hypothetical protein